MLLKFIKQASVLLLFPLSSCSHHEIRLDVVHQSSDLLSSDIVYGTSTKKIQEENEIILQLGKIDTTTEQSPIDAAIINVNKVEIILNLSKRSMLDNKIIEEYSCTNYHLVVSYMETTPGTYKATCTITNNKLKSVYNLEGMKDHHL